MRQQDSMVAVRNSYTHEFKLMVIHQQNVLATVRQQDSMVAVRKVLGTGGEWKLLSELHLVNTVQYPVGCCSGQP